MTLEHIIKLTSNRSQSGELKTVEFKSSIADLKGACQTLCGFLNYEGGVVLIGVKNDGKLIGQNVTDRTKQEIANEIKKFEPAASIEVFYVLIENNKFIIALTVLMGSHKPYIYDGRAYQRIESSISIMPQHLYEKLIVEREQFNHSWESFITKDYKIEDLDVEEISKTVRQGIVAQRILEDAANEDVSDTLSRLKLLENGKLKNAAVVLFAKEVFPRFGQCKIQMARFRGTSKLADFEDNQRMYGNAFKLLNDASEFLRRHLNIASFYQNDSFVRIDKPTLPVLAVREALINAICHRNYQSTGAVSLAIFDDRIEIWNTGVLPKELKVEDLTKKHDSYPRNELIAETFYKRGLIEGWGTGIMKMTERCREHGIPDPQFEEYSSGLSVTFVFEKPIGSRELGNNKVSKKAFEFNLSKRQQQILSILEKFDELKLSEINDKLDKKIPERTLRADLFLLKGKDIISSRGRTRSTQWFLTKLEK